MILRDRVQITGPGAPAEPVRAHVGPPVSKGGGSATLPAYTEVTILVILEPDTPFDPDAHGIHWRGEDWYLDGRPTYVRRHGRDHHVTVPLRRTVAS